MDRSYRDFDAYLREIEQERQLERQDRCPPEIPVPFGALLVAIVVLPLAIPLFLWLSVTRITEIIADLVVFNHQTFVAFVRDKFEKGSPTCGGRLCSLFNWYTGLYVLINIVLVIGWALLVALYPVVGVMHTMVECAWRAYDESDMWEESLVAGLGDVVRLNKADKEACAEQIAQYCAVGGVSPGRWLLAAGDFFLLTGVFEGIKCIQPMLNLHQRLLGLVDSVLDQTNNAHSGLEVATTAGVKAAKTVQKAAEVLEELGIKIPVSSAPAMTAHADILKQTSPRFALSQSRKSGFPSRRRSPRRSRDASRCSPPCSTALWPPCRVRSWTSSARIGRKSSKRRQARGPHRSRPRVLSSPCWPWCAVSSSGACCWLTSTSALLSQCGWNELHQRTHLQAASKHCSVFVHTLVVQWRSLRSQFIPWRSVQVPSCGSF